MVRGSSVWSVAIDTQGFNVGMADAPVGGLLFHQSLAADRKVSPFKKHTALVAAEDSECPGYRLLDYALRQDSAGVVKELVGATAEDIDYKGTRQLKVRTWEIVLNAERPLAVVFDHNEYRTDSTPLFAAAHSGNAEIVGKLLVSFMLEKERVSEMTACLA